MSHAPDNSCRTVQIFRPRRCDEERGHA
jgi:hypothetical protein